MVIKPLHRLVTPLGYGSAMIPGELSHAHTNIDVRAGAQHGITPHLR